ncbi:MAG: sigma-54-dependent transcriptional regulator [Planctomycetota bacterium]
MNSLADPIRFPQPSPRVLVLDDERMIRWSLRSAFEEAGALVEEAASLEEGRRRLQEAWPDLLVLDLKLPDGNGIDFLKEVRSEDPNLPTLVITAFGSVRGAVEAIREGAFDYVSKPFDLDDLLLTSKRALERLDLGRIADFQARKAENNWPVAVSPKALQVAALLKRIGRGGASTVLITGESGVGKNLAARMLHASGGQNSRRSFITVPCTAIPESLLESEIFGHERGAFTDAREAKRGLAELAWGGTLFLDEVGDLPAHLQAKMLSLLEDRVFRRVGGTRLHRLEACVVAATNRDLEEEVRQGRFRPDLYYRLKVVPIEIPPLRERREDIRPLAQHFLNQFRRQAGVKVEGFGEEVLADMEAYSWPGNVRELRNAVERAVLLTTEPLIGREDLPPEVSGTESRSAVNGLPSLPSDGVDLARVEKAWVEEALNRSHGNRSRAARLLGMNRDQIRYRIHKFGLETNGSDGS